MTAPTAIVVIGPAGSGKSTVSRAIAQTYEAVYLDKDSMLTPLVTLAMALMGERPDNRESSLRYRREIMPAEYESLARACGDNLSLGRTVVIDAPFATFVDKPTFLEELATKASWPATTRVIAAEVSVSEATVKARLVARANPRDKWKLSHWEEFWESIGSVKCRWRNAKIVPVGNDGQPDLGLLDIAMKEW